MQEANKSTNVVGKYLPVPTSWCTSLVRWYVTGHRSPPGCETQFILAWTSRQNARFDPDVAPERARFVMQPASGPAEGVRLRGALDRRRHRPAGLLEATRSGGLRACPELRDGPFQP